MSEALAKLAEHGPLGIICAILIYMCFRLYQDNQKLHKEREQDTKETLKTVLEQNTKVTDALSSNTAALHSQKEATIESRQAFKELSDDIRTRFPRQR